MLRRIVATLTCLLIGITSGTTSSLAAEAAPPLPADTALDARFNMQAGKITLPNGVATLNLPSAFRYLQPWDAEQVLTGLWGNPPGSSGLGLIVPAGVDPGTADAWGVVVTYRKDGHVSDEDAADIDYTDLLQDMKEAANAANAVRAERGYDELTLIDWAEPPRYDKTAKKFHWALQLQSSGAPEQTLNYDVRILGREGVLVLTAISRMSKFPDIKTQMTGLIAATEFTPGNRYGDFNAATDKVAEYGLATLVAGGAAAKLGFFGKLFALLAKFSKLLVLGLMGLAFLASKLVSRPPAPAQPVPVDLSK